MAIVSVYPKITIVTPSYNQGRYLEQTILSVLDQNYPNLEYMVIDGGSTDDSVEIIKKYEKHLAYWVSEKDKGQSDAINKGLKRFTGDIFNWLNSDDYLEKDALFKIAEAFNRHPQARAFCFTLSHLKGNVKIPFNRLNNPSDPLQCFCDPVINQPSTFYHKEAIDYFGSLNVCLHYCMDYEWWLKFLFRFGVEAVYAKDEKVAVFRIHEESKTSSDIIKFDSDIATILNSLAERAGLNTYPRVLKEGFSISPRYTFSGSILKADEQLIERMIVYFLLKKGHLIYQKNDFYFAKYMLKHINFNALPLDEKEEEWLQLIKRQTRVKNWLLFKVLRKLRSKMLFETK